MAIKIPSKNIYSITFDPIIDNKIDSAEITAKECKIKYDYDTHVFDHKEGVPFNALRTENLSPGDTTVNAVRADYNDNGYRLTSAIIISKKYFTIPKIIIPRHTDKTTILSTKSECDVSIEAKVDYYFPAGKPDVPYENNATFNPVNNAFDTDSEIYVSEKKSTTQSGLELNFNEPKLFNIIHDDQTSVQCFGSINSQYADNKTTLEIQTKIDALGLQWSAIPTAQTTEADRINGAIGTGISGGVASRVAFTVPVDSGKKYKLEIPNVKLPIKKDVDGNYYIESAEILCGYDISMCFGYAIGEYIQYSTSTTWCEFDNAKEIRANQVRWVVQPHTISITVYGDTVYLDVSEKTISVKKDENAESVFSFDGNELIQTTNTPSVESKYGIIVQEWGKGKQTATISCPLDDYYDENNNKVIDINSSGKMLFERGDVIIPYRYTNKGDIPMSYNNDFSPKQFKVIGTKISTSQGVTQELTILEY